MEKRYDFLNSNCTTFVKYRLKSFKEIKAIKVQGYELVRKQLDNQSLNILYLDPLILINDFKYQTTQA